MGEKFGVVPRVEATISLTQGAGPDSGDVTDNEIADDASFQLPQQRFAIQVDLERLRDDPYHGKRNER